MIGLRSEVLPNSERCLAVGNAAVYTLGRLVSYLLRIMDFTTKTQHIQIAHVFRMVIHQSCLCALIFRSRAVAVGHTIACLRYKTITNRSLLAEQDEKPGR